MCLSLTAKIIMAIQYNATIITPNAYFNFLIPGRLYTRYAPLFARKYPTLSYVRVILNEFRIPNNMPSTNLLLVHILNNIALDND